MRFRLQLTSIDDQRSVIPRRQDTLRSLLQHARQTERELYMLERARDHCDDVEEDITLMAKIEELQQSLDDTKEQVQTEQDSCIDRLIDLLIDLFVYLFVCLFIVYLFIYSLIARLLACSFVC